MSIKRTKGEFAFDIFLYILMILLILIFLYPIWTILARSFNEANDTARGGLMLWPRIPTLRNFKVVFENELLSNSYIITISRTLIGTVAAVTCTGLFAYGLSKKKLMFRNFYLMVCIITMFFGGGLIATTINITNLGLANNFLVFIIPGLYNVMHMLIMKTFFSSLPSSLEESAIIDGANDYTVFFKIVLPNSMPVISTIALMTGVSQWNSWFDAYIFITDKKLMPVQYILQRIVLGQNAAAEMSKFVPSDALLAQAVSPYSVQLATLVVAIGPIVFIYPFFQRYFIKGFLLGAVKE